MPALDLFTYRYIHKSREREGEGEREGERKFGVIGQEVQRRPSMKCKCLEASTEGLCQAQVCRCSQRHPATRGLVAKVLAMLWATTSRICSSDL